MSAVETRRVRLSVNGVEGSGEERIGWERKGTAFSMAGLFDEIEAEEQQQAWPVIDGLRIAPGSVNDYRALRMVLTHYSLQQCLDLIESSGDVVAIPSQAACGTLMPSELCRWLNANGGVRWRELNAADNSVKLKQ